ncbi:hypothetical protein DOT37_22865 [Pantoea agglomerans]|jgi:hypothetical protein|nr:hypothetical protein DOT37_22865 [Pantoea agglomerans]
MKKRFSFSSAHERPESASSAAALHHRVRPGLMFADAPGYGHVFAHSTPGTGKSALFPALIKAVLKTERAGGQHAQ